MDFAKGVITFGAKPNDKALVDYPGCTVCLGRNNLPESVVGTFLDVKTNSNKFYAIQRIQTPSAVKIVYTFYGRIGGTVTTRIIGESDFGNKVHEKFGCYFSEIGSLATKPGFYAPVIVEIAEPVKPVAKKADRQPNAGLEKFIPEQFLSLFKVILNVESIKESIVANAINAGVEISSKFTFPLAKIEKAKAICASVMNSPALPAAAVLEERYGQILELIPMSAGARSAYSRIADAAHEMSNWKRFETVLDMMHQAALSLRQLETPDAEMTEESGKSESEEFLTMLFAPQDAVLHSCGPNDIIETMKDLLPFAASLPLPYISKFLNFDCRMMMPNEKDMEICTRLIHNIRMRKFEVFSIMPQANRRKQFNGQITGLFFHGTSISAVPAILSSELDVKFCSGGRLGKRRIYLADNLLKSMQYASKDSQNSSFFFVAEAPVPHDSPPSKVTVTTRDCDENDLSKILFADSGDCRYGAPVHDCVPDGYFDSGAAKCKLPALKPVNTSVKGLFSNAEYTYGNNDQVALRYLLRVYF